MLVLLSFVYLLVAFGLFFFVPEFFGSQNSGFDDEGECCDFFALVGFVDELKPDVVVALVGEPQTPEHFGLNQILNLLSIRRHSLYYLIYYL